MSRVVALQDVINRHRSPIRHECERGHDKEHVREPFLKFDAIAMHSPARGQMLVALTQTLSVNREGLFAQPCNVLHLLCRNTSSFANQLLSVILDSNAKDLAGMHRLLIEGDESMCGTKPPHPLSAEEAVRLSSMPDKEKRQMPLHVASARGESAEVHASPSSSSAPGVIETLLRRRWSIASSG